MQDRPCDMPMSFPSRGNSSLDLDRRRKPSGPFFGLRTRERQDPGAPNWQSPDDPFEFLEPTSD
jgi:hypothetical protein